MTVSSQNKSPACHETQVSNFTDITTYIRSRADMLFCHLSEDDALGLIHCYSHCSLSERINKLWCFALNSAPMPSQIL